VTAQTTRRFALAALVLALGLARAQAPAGADEPKQDVPQVKIPQPGVPQIMTMEGRFIRIAYNNEGYATLGYRVANLSVGQEWMLLEIGLTVRDGVPEETLTRDALSLDTPDGKTIPLASVQEFRAAPTAGLVKRAEMSHDRINYFPPQATRACRIGFFSDLDSGAKAWDQVSLNSQAGCLGRIFFHVPGGIQHGQHWLNVKFEKSLVRVPFRILTDEEYKVLDKHYKNIEKQVKDAFKKKG
jgi:hypothetical protein